MPATPRLLARRLDRVSRAAHAFHRRAHHPLCAEYGGEVLRLGRRARVCRGCTLALAGFVLGASIGALRAPDLPLAASFLGVALLLGSLPTRRFGRRLGKLATRLLPTTLLAYAASGGLAPFLVALAITAYAVQRYRRRGPDREPCRTCPERAGDAPCRGFAPIVRRERAFQRFARNLGQRLAQNLEA